MDQRKPFLVAWLAFCGIIGAILIVRLFAFPGLNEGMDFRQLYTGGLLLRTDPAHLYDFQAQKNIQDAHVGKAPGFLPFNHPPYEAMFFAPFSRLSYQAAYRAFVATNLILLLLCFYAGNPFFSRPGVAQPKAGLQLFAFLPVTMTILQGQDAILLLLGSCLVLRALKGGKLFTGGLLLGALLFKPQIALPLGAFLTLRFGILFFAGFGTGGLLVVLISALAGWQALTGFLRAAATTGTVGRYGALGVLPLAMPNLRGLLFPLREHFILTLGVSALIAVWVGYVLVQRELDLELSFAVATVAAILVSYHLNFQDLTVLLLPFSLIAGRHLALDYLAWVFYLVPPLLFIASPNALFVLALPLLVLLFLAGDQSITRQLARGKAGHGGQTCAG